MQKEPQARCALGVPKSNFPIKQLGPNRLSGVGGWGLGGPPRLSAYVANSLSTRKLLAGKGHLVALLGSLNRHFSANHFSVNEAATALLIGGVFGGKALNAVSGRRAAVYEERHAILNKSQLSRCSITDVYVVRCNSSVGVRTAPGREK
jgi:hypothetical protein